MRTIAFAALLTVTLLAGCGDEDDAVPPSKPKPGKTGGSGGSSAGGTSAGGTGAGGTSAGDTSAGGTSAGGMSAGGTSAGGASGGSAGGGGGVSGDCLGGAEAFCKHYQGCFPSVFSSAFVSQDDCMGWMQLQCRVLVKLPGSGVTESSFAGCLATVEDRCDTFTYFMGAVALLNISAVVCPTPGKRGDGEGCSSDLQCESLYCGGKAGECGACQARLKPGDSCGSGVPCALPLACRDGTCQEAPQLGDPCAAQSDCPLMAACDQGTCVAQQVAGPSKPCDELHVCEPDAVCYPDDKCSELYLLSEGSTCGTGLGICPAPTSCAGGKCVQRAKTGEACDEEAGPRCAASDECVQGVCTAFDFVYPACP